MTELLCRALLVFVLWIGVTLWVGNAGVDPQLISILVLLGAVAIFLGPLAAEGGFWARLHYVNSRTPGCVWYVLGLICWGIAVVLVVTAG